jgi:hypothetical protein
MTSRHTRAAITGHRVFGPAAALHRVAIDDIATQHAMLRRILGGERGALGLNAARRMVKSAVLGRT